MDGYSDKEGLLEGLHTLTRSYDDTKILSYLATNSTAGNRLGLKYQAHSYVGDYALDDEDIKDIRRIKLAKLLEYNLIDSCAAYWLYNKQMPIVREDNQSAIYTDLMLPSNKVIIQTQLNGMPMSKSRIKEVKKTLKKKKKRLLKTINNSVHVAEASDLITENARRKDYETRKAKAKNPDRIAIKPVTNFDRINFNINSGSHLGVLFHEILELPILARTAKGSPSTDADTIKALINNIKDSDNKKLLNSISKVIKIETILNTFISAFEKAVPHTDEETDIVYLHGSFNLNGTVSGRMSSSKPNLQNIPAGSEYGKLIKSCFVTESDSLFVGSDFSSLEDRISALQTNDPNKLKVYTDGYDGHCLRAYSYFKNEMPDIVMLPEDSKLKCYSVEVDGQTIVFNSNDTIHYNNESYNGKEFYKKVSSGL